MAENTENPVVSYKNLGVLDLPNSNNDTPWVIVYNTVTGRFDRRDISTLPSVVPTLAAVLAEGNVSGTPVLINNGTEQTGLYHNGLIYSAAEGEVFIGFTEPSENRTILFPNASGTVALLEDGVIQNLQSVTQTGNTTTVPILVQQGNLYSEIRPNSILFSSRLPGSPIWSITEASGYFVLSADGVPKLTVDPDGKLTIANNDSFVGTFDPSNITENKTYMLPNNDGELALKELTVPLSGTETDKPITGNIELQDGIQLLSETDTYIAYIQPNLEGSGEFIISLMNKSNNKTSYLVFDENQVGLNLYDGVNNYGFSLVNGQVNVNLPLASRGITSTVDYTPNIQSLDFVQKKYVDRYTTRKIFSTSLAGASTTGTETISYAVPIKASDLGEGILSFEGILSKIGTAGNGTIRVYRSNSATSFSGALQLMIYNSSSAQNTILIKRDNIMLRNGVNQSVMYSTTSSAPIEGAASTALSNINYDFSTDHFLLFTVSASSGDTVKMESCKVTFNKN